MKKKKSNDDHDGKPLHLLKAEGKVSEDNYSDISCVSAGKLYFSWIEVQNKQSQEVDMNAVLRLPINQSRNFNPNSNQIAFQTNEIYNLNSYYVDQKGQIGQIFRTWEPTLNANLINSQLQPPQKAKKLLERKGDWHCKTWKNLNFAFRKTWNRCQAGEHKF